MSICCRFFFNDTATTEIYTLSLHDALPIWRGTAITRLYRHSQPRGLGAERDFSASAGPHGLQRGIDAGPRGEAEGTLPDQHLEDRKSTRLNSSQRQYLVCRLLLEKKKT